MKFYLIPPNKHLDLMVYGDGNYFALAHHYLSDENYRKYFLYIRKVLPDAFITLDNGAAEHSLVTQDVLLDIVGELKPNEVIAPDVLFDKKQTLANLNIFAVEMIKKGYINHTNLFGCPQGATKEEWLDCYKQMINNPLVSTIGLSKIAVPKCWNNATNDTMIAKSRNECVQELYSKSWLEKPLHLLGMGEHTEYNYYLTNKIPNIRSSDSCYTVLAAIHGIRFDYGDTTRIPTTNDYFNVELTERQKETARANILYLRKTYQDV